MDNFTVFKMEGETVDIMRKVNSAYLKFVCLKRGKKVMQVRLLKALYGYVKSELLLYELFITTLQEFGFKLNPHDECIANKVINGKQCTIS